jgi:hypothetical protein
MLEHHIGAKVQTPAKKSITLKLDIISKQKGWQVFSGACRTTSHQEIREKPQNISLYN